MRKGQIWKDKSGGLWEIVVLDDQGEFPIGAKSLSQDRLGLHLFTRQGKYQAGAESLFDLVEQASVYRAPTRHERDDIFLAACHAMSAGMSAVDAMDAAIKLVQEFRIRVRP